MCLQHQPRSKIKERKKIGKLINLEEGEIEAVFSDPSLYAVLALPPHDLERRFYASSSSWVS